MITAPPSPPQNGDIRAVFNSKMNQMLSWFAVLVSDINSMISDMTALQSDVTSKRDSCTSSVQSAAQSSSAAADSATTAGQHKSAAQNYAQSASQSASSASTYKDDALTYAQQAIQAAQTASAPVNTTTVSSALATAADIADSVPTRIAVDQSSNGAFKWQSITSFFHAVGRVLHVSADNGRYVTLTSADAGSTLSAGGIYGVNADAAFSLNMPTLANTQVGVDIEFLQVANSWGVNVVTINMPANTFIAAFNTTYDSFLIDSKNYSDFKLRCSSKSTTAIWEII